MNELTLDNKIINAIKTVFDPEIPVDIYELGLIYKCEVTENNDVLINMTLTSPNCPVAEELPMSVKETVQAVEGVNNVKVDIVWEPPWDMSRMSEIARLELDMM
jgi:FeS assembly SUF system protein